MSEENTTPASPEEPAAACSAADALKRAKAELEKAQAFYETVRQQATERLKAVRQTSVGDVLDGTLEAVKRHPGASLTVAALVGFFLGRLFRRCSVDCPCPHESADDELLRRKRELHLRIGRSRRRIDGRLRATQDHARQLLSWRTYVVRYPGWALAAALGAGMAASAGLRPARISRWLGGSLVRQALGGLRAAAWGRTAADLDRFHATRIPMNDPAERPLLADLRDGAWRLGRRAAGDGRGAVGTGPAGTAGRSALGQTIGDCLAGGRRHGADGAAAAGGLLWPKLLDGCGRIARGGWLLIFAGGLLILAVAGGYLAWRRFRRRFIGLRETLEELREDLLWLREEGGGRGRRRRMNDEWHEARGEPLLRRRQFDLHPSPSVLHLRPFNTSPPRSPGGSSRASGRRGLPGR